MEQNTQREKLIDLIVNAKKHAQKQKVSRSF